MQQSVQDVPIRMCWTRFKVDYYGTPTPLQQVGNISVPEARIIHDPAVGEKADP